ncbi:hypothetical protein [Bradyrhizobium sp. dw_411]|uniref:hypothetical protein n=1 Tax=Bradyrhizobium sp. dw_411 TaxID=2720082 RepID=UPI001BCAD72C|nr:hypothetical protein [Bradyrhizobium sp. dw_411]
MKIFAVLVAVCALSSPALAQNCRGTPDVDGRLACHDNYAPAEKSTLPKPSSPAPARASAGKPDPNAYIDEISAEDARMQAQLKNICRGC